MRFKIGKSVFVLFDRIPTEKFVLGLQSNSFSPDRTKNVIFIDVDDAFTLQELVKEIKKFQKKFDLSTAYIYESSPGKFFFAIFNLLDYDEWSKVISYFPGDIRHTIIALADKTSVLRISAKKGNIPKLVKIVRRKSKTRKELPFGFFVLENILRRERELQKKYQNA